jgi:hypothetical protein
MLLPRIVNAADVVTHATTGRGAGNLRSDELVSFSPVPTPMNSITSKLRVRPSYLMRGEEVIWGENYASRYIVSTNHRTALHASCCCCCFFCFFFLVPWVLTIVSSSRVRS